MYVDVYKCTSYNRQTECICIYIPYKYSASLETLTYGAMMLYVGTVCDRQEIGKHNRYGRQVRRFVFSSTEKLVKENKLNDNICVYSAMCK